MARRRLVERAASSIAVEKNESAFGGGSEKKIPP
jgi:hypothetical protein